MSPHEAFMLRCKQNYLDGITPSSSHIREKKGYIELVSIAKSFGKDRDQIFSALLFEGQYFIALWAAHLLIEYGQPDAVIKKQAIDIIKEYSTHELFANVAEEEKQWLRNNLH